MMTTYNIDRNTAARLLNVSVRTVDRYISSDKLSSVKSDGRIWLSKEEILNFLNKKTGEKSTHRQEEKSRHVDRDISIENNVHMATPSSTERPSRQHAAWEKEPTYSQNPTRNTHEIDLDKLYEELKSEMAIKDKRLAQASYKIGQLEAQISLMVPKLELDNQQKLLTANIEQFQLQLNEKEEEIEELHDEYSELLAGKDAEKAQLDAIRREELDQKDILIRKLDEELHMEKVNKWVYAIILYLLVLGFIALWLVLKWL